jgi:hypothetical protein
MTINKGTKKYVCGQNINYFHEFFINRKIMSLSETVLYSILLIWIQRNDFDMDITALTIFT